MNERICVGSCRFGAGVFARARIYRGEEILRFSGPLIDLETVLAKGMRQSDPLQIGPGLYLDIGPPGVLVNHSCAPNAGIRDDVRLVALSDIVVGEEIFYDYSTTMGEEQWTLTCLCGSDQCRGEVGDFKDLPFRTRRRYLRLGVVQSYLARQFIRRYATERSATSHDEHTPKPLLSENTKARAVSLAIEMRAG